MTTEHPQDTRELPPLLETRENAASAVEAAGAAHRTVECFDASFALKGHIRTLRLSGRNDGMVEDMQRAADALDRPALDLSKLSFAYAGEFPFATQVCRKSDVEAAIKAKAAVLARRSVTDSAELWELIDTYARAYADGGRDGKSVIAVQYMKLAKSNLQDALK